MIIAYSVLFVNLFFCIGARKRQSAGRRYAVCISKSKLHLIGGKTGFTNPAGQCLATWAQDAQLNTYICVVAGSTTNEPLDAMGDTLTLYQLISEPAATISRIRPQAANLPDYVHN